MLAFDAAFLCMLQLWFWIYQKLTFLKTAKQQPMAYQKQTLAQQAF
jgi:hypothetical protein